MFPIGFSLLLEHNCVPLINRIVRRDGGVMCFFAVSWHSEPRSASKTQNEIDLGYLGASSGANLLVNIAIKSHMRGLWFTRMHLVD